MAMTRYGADEKVITTAVELAEEEPKTVEKKDEKKDKAE